MNALGLGTARPGIEALPYRTRDDFLSPAELNLYRVLQMPTQSRRWRPWSVSNHLLWRRRRHP
jgi:hypothetical protein